MKKILTLCVIALGLGNLYAQEEKSTSPLDFSAGIQTNHLWRGLVITDSPMISAMVSLNLNQSRTLQVGTWGGTSISNDSDGTHYQEINYFVQYSNKGLTLGLWDLFNSRNIDELTTSKNIFNYSNKRTNHLLDFRSSYQFQGNVPLTLEADVILYGSGDTEMDKNDLKQRYSTYIQVAYPVIKGKKVDLDLFAGAGFALNGETHLYGNGKSSFDIVNVGFTAKRDIKIFDHKIPVVGTVLWNPSKEVARVQLAIPLF